MTEKLLRPQEVAVLLRVHPQTLRMWDRRGKLKAVRLPSGQRRYRMSELEPLLQTSTSSEERTAAVYARVRTRRQAEVGDLERQRTRLLAYAAKSGYHVVLESADTASGLNTHRRGLRKAIERAKHGEFHFLLIEHPDRLARLGYEYLRELFDLLGVTIIATGRKEGEDANAELVKDLLAIVTSFSGRLYGARAGRKARAKLDEALRALQSEAK